LFGIALATVAVRLPFFGTPLSVDEGGYAYVARFWARGFHLYRDVWVDRPQGLLFLFRAAEAPFGPHGWAVRLLAAVFAGATASLLGVLVARLTSQRLGLVAAALWAIISVGPPIEGFAANGELLTALPAVGALAAFSFWLTGRGRTWAPLVAGLLTGCAVLIKQSGYDAGAAIALWLVVAAWLGWRARGEALRALGVLGAGAVAPVALAALHGALTGFHDWWFAVAGYRLSVESVATGSASARLHLLWSSFTVAGPCLVPLIALAPLGVAAAWRRVETRLLVLWLAFALSGFALGGLFHPHYYIGLLAPLCALAALGADRLLQRVGRRTAVLFVAVSMVPVIVAFWPAYTASGDRAVSLASSNDSRIVTDAAVGGWLKANSRPTDTIYALYADASLYFAADRRSPFKYLWFLNVAHIPGALHQLEDVLRGPAAPRYVAVYQSPGSIDRTGTVQHILETRYRPAITIQGVPILARRTLRP
jgi:4-amino-4-deoxy-L-arabinose transferase-like glycosyltransferase